LAEIILPPEEEQEETPQAPELNIDKPTENSKVITIEFEAKETAQVSTKDTNQQLYTTDTDAWFEFKETTLENANGTYSAVFRNRHDGSIFQRTGDVVNGVAYYKIPEQEIRHAGKWHGQLVYTLENGNTTAREFGYDVKGHILDGKDVREIVVEDFETLMSQLRSMKDNAELELASLVNTANQNETDRQAFFDDLVDDIDRLQSNYQELLDTGVLQTNINNKLEQLEEEYAPKLTEVTAQLAQTVKYNENESITKSMLSQDIKEELNNGEIEFTLNTSEIDEGAITPPKTNFLRRKSPNLLDLSKATEGYSVSPSTGLLNPNATYSVSDFIPVKVGGLYSQTTRGAHKAFYENKNIESFVSGTDDDEVIIPPNVNYIRVSYPTSRSATEMFVEGSSLPPYAAYSDQHYLNDQLVSLEDSIGAKELKSSSIGAEKLKPSSVTLEKMSFPFGFAIVVNASGEKIQIDTEKKTMTYKGLNIVTNVGNKQGVTATGSASWADDESISEGFAVNIWWNAVNKEFEFFKYTDARQNDLKNNYFFGTLFKEKLHGSFSNGFVVVNGVEDGGWYVEPEIDLPVDTSKRIFTLNEAWNHFESGEKFPIAFLGDSTTDGDTTTNDKTNVLGTDHINENAYPYILQQHIRQETGNDIARVYNAGFSGTTASWAKTNIEQIFGNGTPYEDVKMVGIGYGINDSMHDDIKTYYDTFKSNVEWLINYFKNKGIQPFLVTTQATLMKNGAREQTRTHRMNTVANGIKKELANKYNLEYIDTNKYTEMFLLYSKEDINAIIPDSLHFGDVGHRYEGDFYFSEISPRVIKSSNVDRISMLTQNIKTDLNDTQFTRSDSSTYKYIVDFEREIASDLLILDVLLFNDEKTQVKLNIVGDVVIKINGVEVDVETFELDLGLHKMEVISKSESVYFEGIEIVRM
jgi:lysophospholipase L1-like esterase